MAKQRTIRVKSIEGMESVYKKLNVCQEDIFNHVEPFFNRFPEKQHGAKTAIQFIEEVKNMVKLLLSDI